MGLQPDAIRSRLEGLKADDRRAMYDSKMRAFRREGKGQPPSGTPGEKPPRVDARTPEPMDQVILMLEELTRRIDGLEKKNRNLGDEIRYRGREERRWRSVSLTVGLIISMMLYLGGLFRWI